MHLSMTSIDNLLASEYTQATQEVKDFVAWIKSKDAEVRAAEAEFQGLILRQQQLGATLARAGYTVNAGSISAPAA